MSKFGSRSILKLLTRLFFGSATSFTTREIPTLPSLGYPFPNQYLSYLVWKCSSKVINELHGFASSLICAYCIHPALSSLNSLMILIFTSSRTSNVLLLLFSVVDYTWGYLLMCSVYTCINITRVSNVLICRASDIHRGSIEISNISWYTHTRGLASVSR